LRGAVFGLSAIDERPNFTMEAAEFRLFPFGFHCLHELHILLADFTPADPSFSLT
jgi:hypothetical protein